MVYVVVSVVQSPSPRVEHSPAALGLSHYLQTTVSQLNFG